MTTIPQLPTVTAVGSTDLVPLSQAGTLYAASVEQIIAGLQSEIVLPTGEVLGRASAGAGEPEALSLGAGLALVQATLQATGTDHLGLTVAASFAITDEVVVNADGTPARLPMSAMRALFTAGSGIAIDPNGTLSVTASAIAGPVGPQGPLGLTGAQGVAGPAGPQGAGLQAPATGNDASTIAGSDYIAIWQNGANAWITYQQLIGGQTIDQLPAAGPAADSDLLLVAQSGNALSSQGFSAIWTYVAQKIPSMRRGVVELTANTVLDATTHYARILVASQPLVLTANFSNMGSGFSCRLVNLSAGVVTMGTGIISGSGGTTLPPGTSAEVVGLTYSGGSIVWWNGIAPPSPTITVGPFATPIPNTAFVVNGGLYDETPTGLDYSFNGVTWIAAVSPIIKSTSYHFQIPGLAVGTYVLMVRDHGNPSIVGTSAPFTIANAVASAISISTVPVAALPGSAVAVSGSVSPSGAAVQVGLSASGTVAPTTLSLAIVVGTDWSATLTTSASVGTYFVWAQQVNNTAITTVSGGIVVSSGSTSITYTINQPAVLNVAAGSGTLALNGGVSPPQTTATQIAFSTSNASPPTSGWQSAAIIDNNSVWAVYATVPTTAADYYIWVETIAGTNAVVSPFFVTVS